MKPLLKIVLAAGAGIGAFLLLTTPEQRAHLLGFQLPEDPNLLRNKPSPIPIPQIPDSLNTADLPVGAVVLLKAGPALGGRSDLLAENVTITARNLETFDFLPSAWLYTGVSNSRNSGPILFLTQDIDRVISR